MTPDLPKGTTVADLASLSITELIDFAVARTQETTVRLRRLEQDVVTLVQQRDDARQRYSELLYDVVHKTPVETRHESARRILQQHEQRTGVRLPSIEEASAHVHAQWVAIKRAQGITSRRAENGEELMVPYDQLSDAAKDLDRGTVQAVYAAIVEASASAKVPQ